MIAFYVKRFSSSAVVMEMQGKVAMRGSHQLSHKTQIN